jgi:negative regulator of sigma-B (phosphoserine phosphatase)
VKLSIDRVIVPCRGEEVSGDGAFWKEQNGRVLFAVIDALGHGPRAAEVKDAAIQFLDKTSIDKTAGELMDGLHHALQGTRGAAATLCLYENGRVQGCGVGNVELLAVRAKLPFVLTPGIVGGRMHRLRVFEGVMGPGARVVLYSDGISTSILGGEARTEPFATACSTLMQRYRKSHDDATVLVADVAEGP